MRGFALLPALLLATAPAMTHAEEQDIRQCAFEVKARCLTGEARVILSGGIVQKIEISADWCGRAGAPGYSCTIDSSRGDKASIWSDEGGATIVANAAPFNPSAPDRAKIVVGKNVSIDLAQAQSLGRCGAGAELPQAIVIPAKKGACRVWLGPD